MTTLTFGLSTVALWKSPLPMAERVRVLAEAGVRLLEVDLEEWWNRTGTVDELLATAAAARETGTRILSMHLPSSMDLSALEPQTRRQNAGQYLELFSRIEPALLQLRPAYLVLHAGGPLIEYSASEYESRLAAARESMVALLAHPVFETTRLALENTLTCHFGARPCDLRELLACGPPHKLGFVLDTSHSVFDHSPRQFIEAFPERLLGFHLSDNDRSRSRDLHAPPLSIADSAIDWTEFRALHDEHRLPHEVILELFCPRGQALEVLISQSRESVRKLSELFAGPE